MGPFTHIYIENASLTKATKSHWVVKNFPEINVMGFKSYRLSEYDAHWHRVAPQHNLEVSVTKKYGLSWSR